MEQANRLTLRSVSRPAAAGLEFRILDGLLATRVTLRRRYRVLHRNIPTSDAVVPTLQRLNFRRRRRQLQRRPGGLLEAGCARHHH
jgi:hypothetical protein